MKALHIASLAAVVSVGLCLQAGAHMGGMGGASASVVHATVGMHGHGFGSHPFLPRPLNPFHSPHFRFGDFRSHELGLRTGGSTDYDYAADDEDYGPEAGDDIDNLHFRVQEPFGPGDIGRPPIRAEAGEPYMSDRMDPWRGYEPPER